MKEASSTGEKRVHQEVGGHAASARNGGYQGRNGASSSLLRTLVRVCSKRWAPRSVHRACSFLTNRLLAIYQRSPR